MAPQRILGCMNPFAILVTLPLIASAPTTLAAMRWQRRVLVVSADDSRDRALAEQRRVLAGWQAAGAARDVSVVEVVGDTVSGSTDRADALRDMLHVPARGFSVVLIGKDGGVKLRSHAVIPAATLEATIDAMPMRRAGQR